MDLCWAADPHPAALALLEQCHFRVTPSSKAAVVVSEGTEGACIDKTNLSLCQTVKLCNHLLPVIWYLILPGHGGRALQVATKLCLTLQAQGSAAVPLNWCCT